MTDVWRNSSPTTVFSGIHAETAIAGTRTPDRSNENPHLTGGGRRGRAGDRWRGYMIVGAAVFIESHHKQGVQGV